MSTIGVFIALGGTSYAVARNSVGTRELLPADALGGPIAGPIALLPEGARPLHYRLFAVHTGETPAEAVGRVNVLADGQVTWGNGAGGDSNYTSLEGISFDTQ